MTRFVLAAGLAVAALAGPALAQEAPRLSAIIAGLEDRGYRIRDVDVGRDRIEIEARRPDGVKVDIDINPATGAVIREEVDS